MVRHLRPDQDTFQPEREKLIIPAENASLAELVYHDTFSKFPCTLGAALAAIGLIEPDYQLTSDDGSSYPKWLSKLANP